MMTDRIVSSLHKAVQIVAKGTSAADSPQADASAPATEPHAVGETRPTADHVGATTPHHDVLAPQALSLEAAAMGLPPPDGGGAASPVAAVSVAVALRVIAERFLDQPNASNSPARETKPPVVTTSVDVRPTGEVRETQFVEGVPRAANVIASDDRPRQQLVASLEDDVPRRLEAAADPNADASPPAPTVEVTPAALPLDPDWVASLALALQSGGDDLMQKSGILPSAILNAAMLPGWPPPKLLEGVPIAAFDAADELAERREAAIAALLEMLGVDLSKAKTGKADAATQWRWIRRIALLIAGIMTVVTTAATEIAEMQGEERELAEGTAQGPKGRTTSRRIYLD